MADNTVVTPASIFGQRHFEARKDVRDWSQQQEVNLLEKRFGVSMDRATLARIESGEKRVTLEESVVLAAVLDAPPVDLWCPRSNDAEVTLGTKIKVRARKLRRWARGREPLDARYTGSYFSLLPEGESNALERGAAVFLADLFDAYLETLGSGDLEGARRLLHDLQSLIGMEDQRLSRSLEGRPEPTWEPAEEEA